MLGSQQEVPTRAPHEPRPSVYDGRPRPTRPADRPPGRPRRPGRVRPAPDREPRRTRRRRPRPRRAGRERRAGPPLYPLRPGPDEPAARPTACAQSGNGHHRPVRRGRTAHRLQSRRGRPRRPRPRRPRPRPRRPLRRTDGACFLPPGRGLRGGGVRAFVCVRRVGLVAVGLLRRRIRLRRVLRGSRGARHARAGRLRGRRLDAGGRGRGGGAGPVARRGVFALSLLAGARAGALRDGPCANGHRVAGGVGPRHGARPARQHREGGPGRRTAPWGRRDRQTQRARPGRWIRGPGRKRRQPGAGDRRKRAGRQTAG
jgi:hypothetical protein